MRVLELMKYRGLVCVFFFVFVTGQQRLRNRHRWQYRVTASRLPNHPASPWQRDGTV